MVPQVEIEHSLIEIKKCKIDKLILNRKNETLCQENNEEIERLNKVIETNEKKLEEQLKLSGKKKIEVKLGYCSYREMPDKWNYDDAKILDWCKLNHYDYYHITEIVNKDKLKKVILKGELKIEDVPGILTTVQEPKFTYKIKGGL